MTDQDHIDRIDALTRNARNTWFTLLAALVFVSVTLMGVQHIDFYGVDRATKLPLVGVDVPTRYFFVAAPILITAIYGYFHLYLIRLWDVLSTAPPRVEGKRLGDAIAPWLITDAALHLRSTLRRDNCTTRRTLESGAMVLNFLLTWGFGLVILGFLWFMSWPARNSLMTSIAGVAAAISLISGVSSFAMMVDRMRGAPSGIAPKLWGTKGAIIGGLLAGAFGIVTHSFDVTAGSADELAPVSLAYENIVQKPQGWLPHDIARADFLAIWCAREAVKDCKELGDLEADFDKEWKVRRAAALADMRRPDWAKPGKSKPDFRQALLFSAFLSGADLRGAQMEGVNLNSAQLEGADLRGAKMQGADLGGAQMQGANLVRAQMQGANLVRARMQGADLSVAQMEGAVLFQAQMQEANLRRAQMQGAVLREAQMQGANLRGAQMQGAILSGAQMQGALLHYAQLTGVQDDHSALQETNLSMAINNGGILRFVDLRPATFDPATDFRNAFLDGTVEMTQAFRVQMGYPCQWVNQSLEDEEFYARWRGWIERDPYKVLWSLIAPEEWHDVPPQPLPEDCQWKTGPMPGGASE